MPTYEYECEKCGGTFERFQPITAKPLKKCPVCGGRVKRKIGAGAGVIFKGSGFYETDYKRSRSASANSSKKKETSKKDTDSDKKESKREKKDS
jgi:putative FmdB family regulatory protein